MSTHGSKFLNRYVLLSTVSLTSVLPCLDLLLTFLCGRLPFVFYLFAAASGAVIGVKLMPWLSTPGRIQNAVHVIALTVCLSGLLSALLLTVSSPDWSQKCAWRNCGEMLGFHWLNSPYPMVTPDCSALHMCANEYPLSAAQNVELLRLIEEEGCEPP